MLFRSSVLYWGEIGPDAGEDSLQGPRGYDEFNQAKAAGNFGWPYFVGDNYAYADWDFETQTAGPHFDPAAPINDSPNNTGLRALPPAQPAMIWYPYAASEEFPELGEGGRSALAGEFYTYGGADSSPQAFPKYYDGTLFVMEWMRNWVMALRFDEEEKFLRAEPFMQNNGDFRRPIDLTFGKDGQMYMLEYGSVYGADNDDARLVKISYNTGNRPPVAVAGIVDTAETVFRNRVSQLTSENRVKPLRQAAGQPPLTLQFSSRGSKDLDNDDILRYEWLFDGKSVGSEEANPSHTFDQAGIYQVILKVTDPSGQSASDSLRVKVGNAPPRVRFASNHNQSFFWENDTFSYAVKVEDAEDGTVDEQAVQVLFDYQPDVGNMPSDNPEEDASLLAMTLPGESLIAQSDCKACHTVNQQSVGPSYTAVAQRYREVPGAIDQLAQKIIKGGAGNWGTTHVMSAHPQISPQDAQKMVAYILSLGSPEPAARPLPVNGQLAFNRHTENDPNGRYLLLASYTDQGASGVGPEKGHHLLKLRSARVKTAYADAHPGFTRWGNSLGGGDHKAHILLRDIDLSGIQSFTFEYGSKVDGRIEVRVHSQAGEAIASTPYTATTGQENGGRVTAELAEPLEGRHDVYFVVLREEAPYQNIINLRYINMER